MIQRLVRWEAALLENKYRVYALFCIVGFILYFKSFLFDFTYLDDNVLILNNLPFLSDLGNFINAFAHDVFFTANGATSYYRPLLTLSFMPEAMIGGAIPFFYHLANVAIHLVASCLVYSLFTKLNYSKRISLLTTLIFLVHPVMTQAVALLPGRNDSLLAIFILASFITFLDFIRTDKRWYIIWSSFFFLLSLLTKETAIVLPALFIGYLWIAHRLNRTTLLEFGAGWLIAGLAWLALRIPAMTHPIPVVLHDIFSSFLQNLPATLQLLGKVFFPFNLSGLPIMRDTVFIWGYISVAILILLVLMRLREKGISARSHLMLLFGFAWFLLFLWPPFIITDPSGTTIFFEHRLYIPIIGLLILLAETGVVRVLDEQAGERLFPPWLFVLFALVGITFVHESIAADRLTFWQNGATNSPHSAFAQKNLGAMYYLDKNYPLAALYSKRALELNPREPMVHNNLGLIYAARGEAKEAEVEYLRELAFNPYYDNAHYNLGLLYYNEGRFADAKNQWEETLTINPNYTDAARALYLLNAGGQH